MSGIHAIIAELDALERRASTGPWKHDAMENVGKNWLIGIINCGLDRDSEAVHIITTDDVQGASSDPEADAQFIALVRNHWREISAAWQEGHQRRPNDRPNL